MNYDALKQRLTAAHDIAKEVGRFLVANQAGDIGTSAKGRGDLVTAMDLESERQIKEFLHSTFPEDNFLGEEMGFERYGDGGTWVIDPIDGTSNYVNGLPGYTISIGYEIERWKPVLGVVYDPVLDEIFYASKGGGAFFQGRPMHCSEKTDYRQSIAFTSPPMRYLDYMDDFCTIWSAVTPKVGEYRDYGSAALHLAYVAAGRGDLFFEFSLQYHDMAAGKILVEEAGGVLSPIFVNNKGSFSGSIIASPLNTHATYIEILQIDNN
ncbi:MAG: inositol monophosphatase family protein [Sphaerochaetaceae bacterium]